MPSTDDLFRIFLDAFCPIFFTSTVVVQFFLLYFIVFHTTAKMGVFRYILGHTSVCQLILLSIVCGCQFRMISNIVPVEVRVYGFTRYFGSLINYSLHGASRFWFFMCGMSIIVTMYFKLMSFNWIKMSKTVMTVTFLIFHAPVIISGFLETYLVINVALPKDIQDFYTQFNTDISKYAVIGSLKLQTLSLINFLIAVGSVIIHPVVSLYMRWRILKHLKRHINRFSHHNKAQHQSFVTGLTIQSIVPFVTYFPTFALYVFCVTTKTEIIFQQYFIYLMPAFPAFLDPFVTLYFVVPYRKKIAKWFGLERNVSVAPVQASIPTITPL